MTTLNLKNIVPGTLVPNANTVMYQPLASAISAKINSASAYNSDSTDHTLDIYIVASGGAGAASAANRIYEGLLCPAKKSIEVSLLLGKNVIGAGSIVAKSDVNNLVSLFISGIETS